MTLKEKWIEALTSGRYKQGMGFLKTRGEDNTSYYCCLGVLADIINPNGWESGNGDSYYWGDSDELLFTNTLSTAVQQTLSVKNDEGIPFSEIAEYIKKNIKDEDIHPRE